MRPIDATPVEKILQYNIEAVEGASNKDILTLVLDCVKSAPTLYIYEPIEASVLRNALAHWGPEAQTFMVMEEMAELQKELCKWLRGQGYAEHIAEEIADVQIMLEQMIILHGCAPMVMDYRHKKISRLEERLNMASESQEALI